MTQPRNNSLPIIDKPHLSASSLDMFCRCPESWRRRYIEGDRSPPVLAMIAGKGLHAGAAANMTQKIDSFKDLGATSIVDLSVTAFEEEVTAMNMDNQDALVAKAKDSLVELATVHSQAQAPRYQPAFVEHPFRISLPSCTHDLLGFIDLIGTTIYDPKFDGGFRDWSSERIIVDWKTTKRKPSRATVEDSVQLTSYAASQVHLATDGEINVAMDFLIARSKGVERMVLTSVRDAQDITALAHRIHAVSQSITAGVFPPAVPGSWWCSPGWCGYWSTCKYVNSERREKASQMAKLDEAMSLMEETI